MTSTYFEGEAEGNVLARRGYSRDHRPDCKQVCIALVVTFDGFPLGYEVFAGDTHDSRTVQTIVATMEARHGVVGRVWIADRGMSSAENLAWLRQTGRRYIIGALKAELRKFAVELAGADGWRAIRADRVLAHILVCFLAFGLWKSLERWQQRAGLGNSPRTVLEELARIQSHDVVLPTATHGEIRLRCVTQPDAAQVALLDRRGIVLPKRMRATDAALALTAPDEPKM